MSEPNDLLPEGVFRERDVVTHAYHLRVVKALVAERDEARAERERMREKARKIALDHARCGPRLTAGRELAEAVEAYNRHGSHIRSSKLERALARYREASGES